jgi:hypothetical protein
MFARSLTFSIGSEIHNGQIEVLFTVSLAKTDASRLIKINQSIGVAEDKLRFIELEFPALPFNT